MPQLARRHPLRTLAVLAFEDMHDLAGFGGRRSKCIPDLTQARPRPVIFTILSSCELSITKDRRGWHLSAKGIVAIIGLVALGFFAH